MTSSLIASAVVFLSVGVLAQVGADSKQLFAEWAGITLPFPGSPSAVGFYSAGCLQGGQELPLDGAGYAVMRPSRHRFYGHPALIDYLTALAAARPGGHRRVLLIGDLGPPRGGPTLSGHASHQNGLDADIWFITRAARPTAVEREQLGAPGFVIDRKRLRASWGVAQAGLLVAAADNSEVNRIFVSPSIKRYMCRRYPRASWLYRLRPWWGHEDHFHVRLMCPADSPLCQEQDALDPGDNGCGADLDWWFSSEADREWTKLRASREPRRFPTLPAPCMAMPAVAAGVAPGRQEPPTFAGHWVLTSISPERPGYDQFWLGTEARVTQTASTLVITRVSPPQRDARFAFGAETRNEYVVDGQKIVRESRATLSRGTLLITTDTVPPDGQRWLSNILRWSLDADGTLVVGDTEICGKGECPSVVTTLKFRRR